MQEQITRATRRTRPRLAEAYRRHLSALAEAKLACTQLVGLALLRQILRIVPTLAIGLVIDKVATNRATATLTVIVVFLCLIAAFEFVFASAHAALRRALRDHLDGAIETDGSTRRAAGSVSNAAIDLMETACVAPLATTIMLAALTTASPRIGLLVLGFTVAQLVVALIAGRAQTKNATRDAHAAAIEAAERQRARTRHLLAMLARLAYAATLGLGSLDMIDAVMTPGGLIAALMILRQLQLVAETAVQTWLRAVDLAPRDAPVLAPGQRTPQRAA